MNKIFKQFVAVLLSLILAVAAAPCGLTALASEVSSGTAARTVLMYISAQGAEDEFFSYCSDFLNRVTDHEIPDSVNIVVMTGGTFAWNAGLRLEGAESVRTDCNQVWKMKGAHDGQSGALVPVAPDGVSGAEALPMNDPAMLSAFLAYGHTNYPAEKYDVLILGHGSGPTMGCVTDEVRERDDKQVNMSNAEICSALHDSGIGKIELLTFYACLMGSAEDAAAYAAYTDNILFSSEIFNLRGLQINGALDLLCADPLTDGYTLGKKLTDDTVDYFAGNSAYFGADCTLTVVNTKKFCEQLIPKLTELAGLLTASVTVPAPNGDCRFYDELASVDRAVEYGYGGFDLYDLGNLVSELGINYSEWNGGEDAAALKEARNEYTDLSVAINHLLADDSLLYHRYTDSKSKPTSQTYRRDSDGKLYNAEAHFYATTGLSIYFDRRSSWSSSFYSEQIDGMLALDELDEGTKAFLSKYREAVMLYSLAGSTGRAVSALKNGGASAVTVDDIITYWQEKGLWEIDNAYMGVHNSGVHDVCAFLERAGYDVNAFIADKARQQFADVLTADGLTVSLAESADSKGVYDRVKLDPSQDTKGQTLSVNMRIKIKNDFKSYQGREIAIAHLKDKYVSYADKLRVGEISTDDLMRAAFSSDTLADYLRALYSDAGYEIGLFDGNYYALFDSAGNRYLVQYLAGNSVTPKAQVPVVMQYDDEGKEVLGQLEFTFDENGVGHATSFIPGKHKTDTGDGAIPLSDPIFDGTTVGVILNAESKSGWELSHYEISDPIALTDGASRGLSLQAVPIGEIPNVIGYEIEYYLTDVYGNELVPQVNDSAPKLRNLAHATVTGTGLAYDGQPLTEDTDYEKFKTDDNTFYLGIGGYTGALSAQPSYAEKDVHVYRESMDENETVSVRFYEDHPHVPYVGFKQYYDTFMLGKLGVSQNGSCYTLTSDGGQTATLDTVSGTLSTDDFNGFVALPKLISGGGSSLAYGLTPYLRFAGEEIVREGSPVTVDFGKYGITAYGGKDDVYLPLTTLSDLFETGKNFRVEYNGKNLYVVDGNRTIYASSAKDEDEDYYAPLMTADKRPADLIAFTYNELCFSVDYFDGFPGSARLNDAVAADGLDKALEACEPTIKELLCSDDPAEHVVGLHLLFDGALDDKGHTEFTDWINIVMSDSAFAQKAMELADRYELKTTEASAAHIQAAKNVPTFKEKAYGEESYIVSGDTAVFTFDVFRADRKGWNRYYTDGTAPSERDTYYAFRNALEQAQNDPAVKNFVIDLSTNGGGESDAAMAIMALVTGKSYIRSENTLTGGISVVHYEVDRNLDGKFDEQDSAVSYDLNFAVVTSLKTYSSANMLASLLRENGVLVLGEQSSGGSCSVITKPTPEGWEYSHSSYTRLADADLQNIDGGVPVDVSLVTKTPAGEKDYSALYDIDRLGTIINTYCGGMQFGDVKLDGSVTIEDATLIQRAGVEMEVFSDLQNTLADVNADGRVSILDVTCVQKYLAENSTGTGRTGESFTK